MELKIYSLLNSTSKKAFLKPGYEPRTQLLRRIQFQSGLEIEEILELIQKEQEYLRSESSDNQEENSLTKSL
jgi:succinylarginine dihydrolase